MTDLSPEGRRRFLAQMVEQERRRELAEPKMTGDRDRDESALEAAIEALEEVWEGLDAEWHAARNTLPPYNATEEQLLEVVRLEQARNRAWRDRQAAVARLAAMRGPERRDHRYWDR